MHERRFESVSDALEEIAREADRLLVRSAPLEPPIANSDVQVKVRKILDAVSWLAVNADDRPKGY